MRESARSAEKGKSTKSVKRAESTSPKATDRAESAGEAEKSIEVLQARDEAGSKEKKVASYERIAWGRDDV